jgi:hypothetical protein
MAPNAVASSSRPIEIFLDFRKGFVDKKTGRIYVHGIASDNSVDFQNDIVQISQIQTSLRVFETGWGKFNFDHHDEVVGDITRVAFITPAEAKQKYGIDTVGMVLECEGWIYPVTPETPADSDVREVHKLIAAGARLGFSVQGGVGKRVLVRGKDGKQYTVAVPTFLNKISITPQPVNLNTVCLPFAKSLAAVLCDGGLAAEDGTHTDDAGNLAALLYMGDLPAVDFQPGVDQVLKSLAALGSSGAQVLAGATGGDATRLGASDGGDTPCVCNQCGGGFTKGAKHCANCGAKRGDAVREDLRKSLRGAVGEIHRAMFAGLLS